MVQRHNRRCVPCKRNIWITKTALLHGISEKPVRIFVFAVRAVFQWCVFFTYIYKYAEYASMNEFTCSEQSLRIRRSEKTQHWKSTLSLVPNSDCSIVTHFLLLFEFECMTPTCLQRMPKIYMDDALSCFFYTLYIYRELPSVTIRSAAHQKCCTSKVLHIKSTAHQKYCTSEVLHIKSAAHQNYVQDL